MSDGHERVVSSDHRRVHAVPRFDIRAPRRNDIQLQRFHLEVTVRVGEDLVAVAACILTLTGNLMERRRGRLARS